MTARRRPANVTDMTTTEVTESTEQLFHEDTDRWSYQRIFRKLCLKHGKSHISDKDCGKLLRVSERQIRKARLEGMDDYMADRFSCRLGFNPKEIYGDIWLARGLFAHDVHTGKVKAAEVPALIACGAWMEN